jgi:hypothetical protein
LGALIFASTAMHGTHNYIVACVERKQARFCGNISIGGAVLHGARTE